MKIKIQKIATGIATVALLMACEPKANKEGVMDHENHDAMAHDGTHEAMNEENMQDRKDFSAIDEEQASNILDSYLELKDALVASSLELAKEASAKIREYLKGNTDNAKLKGLYEDAAHIENTDELEHAREHFELMSQNMYLLTKAKHTGKTLYKQFCPMAFNSKGAYWLSNEEEIRNPYFGDKMLNCGKVEEVIASH